MIEISPQQSKIWVGGKIIVDTYTEIYNKTLGVRHDMENVFFRNYELGASKVALAFYRNNLDFSQCFSGANPALAVAAILGDGETKSEYSEFAIIFDNDIAKACYKLKPQLDSWIKQQYPNVSINALAPNAFVSFLLLRII